MSLRNGKGKRNRRGDSRRSKTSKYVGISEVAYTCTESTSRIIAWHRKLKMLYMIANVKRAAKRKFPRSANQRCEVIAAAALMTDSLPDVVSSKAGQKGAPVAIEKILTPKKEHQ